MIRVVIAILLTIAIVAIAIPAIDYSASVYTEGHVDGEIASLEAAAVSLIENEEIPPVGQSGSQRVVTVTLPGDTHTSNPVTHFEIERVHESGSVVTYQVDGRSERVIPVDAPIENAAGDNTVHLSGSGVDKTLIMTLERDPDSDGPIIRLTRA